MPPLGGGPAAVVLGNLAKTARNLRPNAVAESIDFAIEINHHRALAGPLPARRFRRGNRHETRLHPPVPALPRRLPLARRHPPRVGLSPHLLHGRRNHLVVGRLLSRPPLWTDGAPSPVRLSPWLLPGDFDDPVHQPSLLLVTRTQRPAMWETPVRTTYVTG